MKDGYQGGKNTSTPQGVQLFELHYRSQTLTLNGGTLGVYWQRRGCQSAVLCLCTSPYTQMSEYTLILTSQLTFISTHAGDYVYKREGAKPGWVQMGGGVLLS